MDSTATIRPQWMMKLTRSSLRLLTTSMESPREGHSQPSIAHLDSSEVHGRETWSLRHPPKLLNAYDRRDRAQNKVRFTVQEKEERKQRLLAREKLREETCGGE
ncbi:hypothetical protein SELMODRAFT_416229 [Selaginella moellendorffii]|uniref:Uncharacterized protein n=1 Tax=Selaginella moellendorffii TaxID=88036 RepID=D8RYH6_SELML|nr:uncharacterized protein LOC9645962 [Selaginella moellendorffii]EFJ23102.1 hypothetical protein SELMODRAFT_416229 [Selaginella moellendorffii]|eukprot:XP_002976197.1 uncharacterized protein LOC9645962 [Selaginella moellendorffii]